MIDFSDPYLTSEQVMLVRAEQTPSFTDAASFRADADLLVGAQAGTTNFYVAIYDVLDGNEANPRVKLFDTFGASVEAMRSGDIDLVLMDSASAASYVGNRPSRWSASRSAPRASPSCCRRARTCSAPSMPRWRDGGGRHSRSVEEALVRR